MRMKVRKRSVLLAGRQRYSLDMLRSALSEWGYLVLRAQSARELMRVFEEATPSLVIADLTTLRLHGPSLLEAVDRLHPGTPVILIDDYPKLNDALAAVKAGAEGFLSQPLDYERLRVLVETSLARSRQRQSDEESSCDEFPEVCSTFRFW